MLLFRTPPQMHSYCPPKLLAKISGIILHCYYSRFFQVKVKRVQDFGRLFIFFQICQIWIENVRKCFRHYFIMSTFKLIYVFCCIHWKMLLAISPLLCCQITLPCHYEDTGWNLIVKASPQNISPFTRLHLWWTSTLIFL